MVKSQLRNPKGRLFWLQPIPGWDTNMKQGCMICGQCIACGEYKGFNCGMPAKKVLQMWDDWVGEQKFNHVRWWFLIEEEKLFITASVCSQCQEANDGRKGEESSRQDSGTAR